LFGGPRERLAGGLTSALVDRIDHQLQRTNGSESKLEFHYLGLPLAFRARGGFGTHWMYAKEYHLNDPRPRTVGWLNFLPLSALSEKTATINRSAMEELWLALHDPDRLFCDTKNPKKLGTKDAEKVRGWICGSPTNDPNGRDLHMDNWQRLVARLRPS